MQERIPKKSYANRTIIAAANGLQTLTVPLEGGRGSKIHYQDLRISYAEPWIAKHKMALQSAYAQSPYYLYFIDRYHAIFDQRPTHLSALNLEIMKTTWELLRIPKPLPDITNTTADYSQFLMGEFEPMPSYPQVFDYKQSFSPDLSILDWVFNVGRDKEMVRFE